MKNLKLKRLKLKRVKLNTAATVVLLILSALTITAIDFALQPNTIYQVLDSIKSNYLVLVLNFVPVLLFVVFFYFVTNNVFYASSIVYTLFGLASLINNYKIVYRDDPFVPIDVSLGAEALSIVTRMNIKINMALVAGVLLSIAAVVAAGFFVKSRKMSLLLRITGAAVCIFVAIGLNNWVYRSNDLYNKLTSKVSFNVTDNFNKKGFVYCFLYSFNKYSIDVPANYSKQYAESLIAKYTASDDGNASGEGAAAGKKPHVILLMNEAFTDISLNKNLIFGDDDDPLKNFKSFSEEGISGHLIVPNYGGGTANTEYDVLTGCMTLSLSETNTSAFRLVRKDIASLPRFFTGNGYKTMFMHPGEAWFYNRQNVYRYFGIDDQIFGDKFGSEFGGRPEDYKGGLVSDDALVRRIIDEFNRHLASGDKRPVFDFVVSIQNHMPYQNGKYGSGTVQPVKTRIPISAKASEYLSNYIYGLRDADRSLGKLVDFLKQSSEPVVLVFFGDHLPNLGENYLTYKELGCEINENGSIGEIMNCFKVPFLIWANDPAKNDILQLRSMDAGQTGGITIGANYLGPMIYEILGYKGAEPFYDFLNELRQDLPVITRNYYKIGGGSDGSGNGYTTQLPDDLKAKVADYKIWQYYKMTDEEQ